MCGIESRHPHRGTLRPSRRPPHRAGRPPGSWAPAPPLELRAGLLGRRPGPAWLPLRAPLAAFRGRPARPPLPLPARAARLQPASAGSRQAPHTCHPPPGRPHPFLVGSDPPARLHTRALRRLPPAVQTLPATRTGQLRLLRLPLALLLGPAPPPAHHA